MKGFFKNWRCRLFGHNGVQNMWSRSEQGGQVMITGFVLACSRCGEWLAAFPTSTTPVPQYQDVKEDAEEPATELVTVQNHA